MSFLRGTRHGVRCLASAAACRPLGARPPSADRSIEIRSMLGWGRGRGLPVGVPTELFFSKKYGGRGASGRRGDRPTLTCTVPEASQERVRYASAPGCPGRRRASLALTDLHTHHSSRRSATTQ